MDAPPPFIIAAEPDGFFFALAVTGGHYVRGRTPNEPAWMVLYFSGSANLSPFSWMTIAADGTRLSYHRGDEFLTTPEFTILSAFTREGISPGSWFLYPSKFVDNAAFINEETRDAYWSARRRLCVIFRLIRSRVDVPPLFLADASLPPFYDAAEEKLEIFNTVADMIKLRKGK